MAQISALTVFEHRQTIHQLPHGPGHNSGVIRFFQKTVSGGLIFQQNRIQPIIRPTSIRLCKKLDIASLEKTGVQIR
jgi:hypothetical protein